ncbi:MAG: hypothetical protein H7Y32_12115, partial [Chloroflexales bacterium]|nr:hypothetical protein [Chloroflexales bacterium]
HTHSGPVNGSTWSAWLKQGAEMVPPYDASLPHRIAGVAWSALQRLRPVRLAVGTGQCAISVNRRFQRPEDGAVICGRNWGGPVDHAVQVVRIDEENGAPLAAIVNYACHPITVGPDCDLLTPDYPGAMKRVVEQATGATCLFLQGAAGDVGPIRGVARGGANEYKRLGAIVGHEASKVWYSLELPARQERYVGTLESGSPLAIYADEPVAAPARFLSVAKRPLHLPLKQLGPPAQFEEQFQRHNATLNALRESGGDVAAIKEATMLAKRAAMRADLARQSQGRSHRTFELQAFALGSDIVLLGMPGEPFVEIGLAVKRDSPFAHTLFSGYSNIGWAYIPTPAAYPLGGYEVEVSPFAPEAAGIVVREAGELLRSLHAENEYA